MKPSELRGNDFSLLQQGPTGFSRNATLVATVNPPALAGGVFNALNLI